MNPDNSQFQIKIGIIFLCLTLLVVPVMADLANTPWPKDRHDLNNTGLSPYVGSQTSTPKWTTSVGSSKIYYTTPVIGSDGALYIGSTGGTISAVNSDGTSKWTYSSGGVYGTFAIGADGTIYYGRYNSPYSLYALYPNGTFKWQSPATGMNIYGGPAVGADGTIYIGSDKFYAFNPIDGTVKWSYPTGQIYGYGSPVIGSDGTIYVGSADTKIYAINPDGTQKWNYTTGGAIQCSPAVGADGTIYIGNYGDKKVYAINPDGTQKWNYTTGGAMQYGSPAIGADGTIYIGTLDKKIYALHPDGTLKWSYLTGGKIWGSPAIGADGTIYIGGQDKKFYALNPETGLPKWTYTTTSYIDGSPSIGSDGSVYIAVEGTTLYAFPGVVTIASDKINGTAPLAVQFTGTSPLIVTAWHWDFGDGTTSDEQNPLHTYNNGGFYAVNLTISHGYGSNSLVKPGYISAYSPPTAAFMATPVSGKSTLSVTFTDQSTGAPTSWLWDFGDGTTSTSQNPTHPYSTSGSDTITYTVNLTAKNSAGSNTTSKTGYITLYSNPPTVSFTATPRISTTAPLTVQFRDTSTLSPTSWSWDFGDGDSTNATQQNPVHTYANTGTYRVNLTATNAVGSANISKPGFITFVTPGPIDPSYPYLYVANDEGVKYDINGTNPVYVPNTYSFATMGGLNALHISSGAATSDVTTTTNQSGTFYFTNTGGQPTMPEGILMLAVNGTIPDDFSVHIRSSGDNWTPPGPAYYNGGLPTVWNYAEGAVDQTFTRNDFIYGPQNWKPYDGNSYPIYNGQDMSNTANTFRIMFIDLNAGKAYDNIKIEYEFHNLTSFAAFNAYGWYLASNHGTMIMTNDVTGGSTYDASGYMVTGIPAAPVAGFSPSTTSEYNLVPIRFTDTSANVPQSWLWDFGDGTTSTLQNPTHAYALGGKYPVTLTVKNIKGTSTISQLVTISVPPVPVAGFAADVTSGTTPLAVQFNDTSSKFPVVWSWDFGDGTNSTERNVTHWYAPGTYSVKLTATNGGGSNSVVKSNLITVTPNGLANQFRNPGFETGDLTGWTAGTSTSTTTAYKHTESYAVYFPWSGSLASDYVAQHVDLTNVSIISFWGYEDGSSSNSQYFKTYIDGVLVQTDTCAHTWTHYSVPISGYTGVHLVQVAFDVNSLGMNANVDDFCAGSSATCSSSGTSANPPSASFTAAPVNGAAPLTVTFADTSTGSPTGWNWDFGDGTKTTVRNPLHTYTAAGTYTVKLTATNTGGSNTMTRTGLVYVVNATGPVMDYNKTYIRMANHDGIRWDDNGNGTYYVPSGSGGLSAIHVSTDTAVPAGQATITNSQSGTLYATGTGSYQDEIVLLLAVNGTVPDNFAARIKTSGYAWTPTGSSPASTSYSYQTVALNQTFTKADLFYGPQTWKPTQGDPAYPLYAGEDMNSTASLYQLMFVDTRAGLLTTSGLTNNGSVKIEYSFSNLPDNAHFSVYGWKKGSGMGWTNDINSGYTVISPLVVIPPVADFVANQTEGLAPFNARFRDTSLNTPTSWAWDFGDGNTSAKQNPEFTYAITGTYTVGLTATNSKGSDTKTRSKYITVSAPQVNTTTFALAGVNTTTTGSTQTIAVNATNSTVSGNIVTVTNVGSTWDHMNIALSAAPASDGSGNLTGTVQSVEAVAANISVPIASLGSPNVSLSLTMSQVPGSSAAITSTITSDPDASVWSTFTAVAESEKKDIIATAYTVAFTKSNIDNAAAGTGGIIKSANITMAVNHTWVTNYAGSADNVKVMHRSDTGTVTFLTTIYTGTDSAGNDYFVAISPDGLSTFVLTAVAPVAVTTGTSSDTTSGGSLSSFFAYQTNAVTAATSVPVTPVAAVSAAPSATGTVSPGVTPLPVQTTKQKVRITPWPTGTVPAPQITGNASAPAPAPGDGGLLKNPWLLAAETAAAVVILTAGIAGYLRRRRRRRDPLRWEDM